MHALSLPGIRDFVARTFRFLIRSFVIRLFIQATILRMMDEEDGVSNRRNKSKFSAKKRPEQRLLLESESNEDLRL